jgi:amidase
MDSRKENDLSRATRRVFRWGIGLLLLLAIAAVGSVSRTQWRFIVDSIRHPVSQATPQPYLAPADAPIALRPEVVFSTASELAARIRDGELSALEVVDAHLSQIYAYNEALNAVVQVNPDARARAIAADQALARGELWGPLHGVPVTIKDQFATEGLRTTNGYLPQADYVADEDATVVARLKDAGAIVLGKTNQPILGMDIQSANPIFGTTHNPWDLGRTPGGSSGGEGAAIAAGLSPLGMGADVGGSIRIPAHFSGIFGHKPTEGRVSGAGITDGMPGGGFQSWWHRLSYGPLARSIADLALAFSIIAGADVRAVDVPGLPVVYPDPKPPGALRIGWTDEFPESPVSEDTRAALGAFIASLEEEGFPVERVTPSSEDLAENWRVYADLSGMEFGGDFAVVRFFRYLRRPGTTTFPFSLGNYKKTLDRRAEVIARMETFLSPYDIFVCPVSVVPAFEHQAPTGMFGPLPVYDVTLPVDDRQVSYWDATVSYTVPFNTTGNPVVVIPIGASREGLPIGAQLVARRWQDAELLVAAQQLFSAAGDLRHPPGYGAP